MLRIYTTVLEALRRLRGVAAAIELHDRDLGRQMRRAAASVALNMREGDGSSGGTRRERYRSALGSANEVAACIDVALALGYVDEVDPTLVRQLRSISAVLGKIVRAPY